MTSLLKKCPLCLYLLLGCSTLQAAELVFSAPDEAAVQEVSERVLREAYQNIGYHIRVERLHNPRALMLSNAGEFDGELSRVKGISAEFKNLLPVPAPVNFNEGYAFTKNPEIQIDGWESLRPYRLICVIGVQVIRLAMSERNIVCQYVATHEQALQMLHLNRIDIAVLPKINGLHALRKEQLPDIRLSGNGLIKEDLYHFLHNKNAHILPAISDELARMAAAGRIQQIRENYLVENNFN
ncbi:transporter substrate-binding domain-containing protein [Aliiglaciecola sp. CAU 1673]|uniref:substrate-binding periplasmic protein n=1 Tax=Aliiglaciecola sp. CAU 1673 TaxID=3032595 RepID=UPI0023DA798C|nr:transporter substrate-binding domain-containing protein [Aliiglaciecola sp. CAU 1673]MDF2178403.1 transporter substrate-binding domain-containing protein [Aliiglaciecola sp. CAU 1673]